MRTVYILLVLGECHKSYRNILRHVDVILIVALQQVIKIERRYRQNSLYRRRQQNQNINNNDQRFVAVLTMVHLHVSLRQIERELEVRSVNRSSHAVR